MAEFVANVRRQVGWFVLLGIGTIVAIILAVSLQSDLFAKKFQLYFSPPSAASFYEGQAIKFQGFTVGRIKAMDLQDDGTVRITLNLLERYHPMLHEGAIVHLVREGLIGEQTLEITSGDSEKPVVQPGQVITYETAATIEQLLQDIKPAVENANTLLQELSELATWLNDPNSDFRQMGARFNALSQDLNRENVGKLVVNLAEILENLQSLTKDLKDSHVGEQLAKSLHSTSQILSDLRPLTQQISKEGPESLKRINSLINHVNKLSKSLDSVASDLSELTPELPGLARESRVTIAEMQQLLKALQNSWLVGGKAQPAQDDERSVAPPVLEMQP
ncbi:hypothetical protein MMIC_P0555 [Mariprofundus micogutta]|uniref:Mce/MlaD domain-containing protein n=1 Tax=Mariprofundus micogutta TaxID=1921010 RepID=A0A1L8CL19_9PROT|nr:MlaD family protein [Mariprofundus micogutta]GAV19607.1 hypothetical protein MMIC_P0555 [Mariprofundus micogutta]